MFAVQRRVVGRTVAPNAGEILASHDRFTGMPMAPQGRQPAADLLGSSRSVAVPPVVRANDRCCRALTLEVQRSKRPVIELYRSIDQKISTDRNGSTAGEDNSRPTPTLRARACKQSFAGAINLQCPDALAIGTTLPMPHGPIWRALPVHRFSALSARVRVGAMRGACLESTRSSRFSGNMYSD